MKELIPLIKKIIINITFVIASVATIAQPLETKLEIDVGTRYQTIDGYGVNINPAWWLNGEYSDDACNYMNIIQKHGNPVKTYWVTETAGIKNLLGQLDDSASAHLFWDGFDRVYQHGIRNGYGTIPPNDWVYWEKEQGKPLLAFNMSDQSWTPRKQFYEFAQLFRFVKPGAVWVGSSVNNDDIAVYAFLNPNGQLVIFGRNNANYPVSINGIINDLPSVERLSMVITNSDASLQQQKDKTVSNNSLSFVIPAGTLFTLTGFPEKQHVVIPGNRPEPPGRIVHWLA